MLQFTTEELQKSYALLELEPGATPEEIKDAYRDLIRIWHPDRHHSETERIRRKAEEKFREITEAYHRLQSVAVAPATEVRDLVVRTPEFAPKSAATGVRLTPARPLTPVRFGALYGYVEADGRLSIRPQWEFADNFFQDLARVQVKQKYGFINTQGELVISPVFDSAGHFSDGLAAVGLDRRFGYLDRTGTLSIPLQYEAATAFKEGFAVVKLNGKFGYIDASGNMAIPAMYESAESFSRGRARVQLADKWGRVNRRGEFFLDLR